MSLLIFGINTFHMSFVMGRIKETSVGAGDDRVRCADLRHVARG